MIGVEEAKQICKEQASTLGTEEVLVSNALNRILAVDLYSPFSLPSFRQSAMDGYAVKLDIENNEYTVLGESSAGNPLEQELEKGQAIRIFTGAAVPDSADTVIMQEWVQPIPNSDRIQVLASEKVSLDQNIRPIGEQLKEGELALPSGLKLNGAALGLLQSFGMRKVVVARQAVIKLLITGDELVDPGDELQYGQIYESNGISIANALKAAGYSVHSQKRVKDDLDETKAAIKEALENADLILSSGGISVGDHDHLEEALAAMKVNPHFYKVKQKPGKPLYFGTKGNTSVFALPGNPASALSCVYQYVIPHLNQRSGLGEDEWSNLRIPLAHDYFKKGDRAVFLKARLEKNKIHILDGQASSMLQSFALANCMVYLDESQNQMKEGELVAVNRIA